MNNLSAPEHVNAIYENVIDLDDKSDMLGAICIRSDILASELKPSDYMNRGCTPTECVKLYFRDLFLIEVNWADIHLEDGVTKESIYRALIDEIEQYKVTYVTRMRAGNRELEAEDEFFSAYKPYNNIIDYINTLNATTEVGLPLKRYAVGFLDILGFRK